WLHGDKVPAAQLRSVLLYTRIARHNARPMLMSLTRWVRRAGRAGIVLVLDLERVAVTRRPPIEERDGFYYSKAAALDAYESLRPGEPNLDAVPLLGSGQTEIEDRFVELLGTAREGTAAGMLIGGGFGSGKSHLLEHLMRLALDEGYAVSRVVVSKETPLHD